MATARNALIFISLIITEVSWSRTVTGEDCSRWGVTINVTGSGIIQSPGFEGGTYPPSIQCYWTFKVPSLQYVELIFEHLDVERNHLCRADYVLLSSYDDDWRVCGDTIPPRFLVLGSRNPEVAFSSNKETQLSGFRIRYSLLNAEDVCPPRHFLCKNNNCVASEFVCDSKDDCNDGSDETSCGSTTLHPPSSCGLPSIQPTEGNDERIVGGREAVPGSWPWQVSLQHPGVFPSGHFCGGALVNNFWIITAAHCLGDGFSRVRLGLHDSFQPSEGLWRYVDKIYLNPDYKDGKNDIALAKLNAPVMFSPTISPICLPKPNEDPRENEFVHITGWGDTRESVFSSNLKQTKVPVANFDRCLQSHSSFREVDINCFCTGYTDQVHSSCVGDSGGPVVRSRTLEGKVLWSLSGLVSWGSATCDYLQGPAVNTRVSAYLTWIQETLRLNK